MPIRTKLLLELYASYDRVVSARAAAEAVANDGASVEEAQRAVRHAERNFHAAAEGLARQVLRIVPEKERSLFETDRQNDNRRADNDQMRPPFHTTRPTTSTSSRGSSNGA